MNYRFIMDINIDFKSIREYMMSVVLMAPPASAKTKKHLSNDSIKNIAHFASPVTIIMT